MSTTDKVVWCSAWVLVGLAAGTAIKIYMRYMRQRRSSAIAALTAERDSLRAHVEAQAARIKGLEATIAGKVTP